METKLLSLNDISTIFIEEIYEVPKDMFEQLNIRMRGSQPNQQIIGAFNPISKHHWLYDFCVVNPPENLLFSETTYKDNPFLPPEYVSALRDIELRNPARARVYCFGEWGSDVEGLVITNWRVENFDEMELAKTLQHRCGMDMGWIDKSAIIDTLYDKENHTIYVFNEFYKSGQQLTELAAAIKEMNLQKANLYVDSAEPRAIQFFKNEGINAKPSMKGKDSVKAGLMFLQDNTIIVKPNCINFITELENFAYIKDKNTGEYTENTTHEWSHAIDACRYAYSDIYTNRKLGSISKATFGI